MTPQQHYRIVAPDFVASITTEMGRDLEWIEDAAPILQWTCGRAMQWFRDYAQRKGWAIEKMNILAGGKL